MKKEQKQEWDANTLCIPYISLHPSLLALCMTACSEGRGVIIGNTQTVSIPFLFCSFFTSHPYIQSKYLQNVFIYYKVHRIHLFFAVCGTVIELHT